MSGDIVIREEAPQDVGPIGAVITDAFQTAAHASGTEAQIVDRLRSDRAMTHSLVAERDGTIVGHVAVSPASIGGHEGWALIGPVAVLPEVQRQGIGSALMNAALERIRAAGMEGIALVGDPAFYARFGLRAWPGLTLTGVPDAYVLALPFSDADPHGELAYHEAFGTEA